MKISDELSTRFADVKGRQELIGKYGNSNTMFTGENSDGETVTVSIDKERGIILKTYQNNGWLRVNYYNKEGYVEGECFDGRWR